MKYIQSELCAFIQHITYLSKDTMALNESNTESSSPVAATISHSVTHSFKTSEIHYTVYHKEVKIHSIIYSTISMSSFLCAPVKKCNEKIITKLQVIHSDSLNLNFCRIFFKFKSIKMFIMQLISSGAIITFAICCFYAYTNAARFQMVFKWEYAIL